MWLARSSLWKLLALFLLTAGAEAVWFFLALQNTPDTSLETLAGGGALALPCAVSFLLLSALLGRVGCDLGARQSYTLRRLAVTEKAVFTWQWIYNSGCFLLFMCIRDRYIAKNWKLAIAPLVVMIGLFIAVPSLASSVSVLVPVGALIAIGVARLLYKKGLV